MHFIQGKGQSDQHEYAHLTLDNGLTVILVSDPMAERSAASLAIKAGSYQDPAQHLGLAHLLEHMLFLGTEKYPEAGAYQEFIRQSGGSHNAYTGAEITNYYFDTLPASYPEALDRFAQFFIAPTLDPKYIEREINAVDSEYRAKLDDESRRSNEAIKTLYSEHHPAARFTVGNKETLGNITAEQLQDLLQGFYHRYYTPENMALTLVANQPLETLAAYARNYFDAIEKRTTTNKPPLPSIVEHTGKVQLFKTKTEKSIVKFSFEIPSQTLNYATQPARYLSYVLGDESENSLFANLKQQHWVQSLHAGTNLDDGQHAFFTITMSLTEDGVEHRSEIVERLFKTIDNLLRSPISQQYLAETKTLSALNFEYHDYLQPVKLSQILSSRALDIPAEQLMASFHISEHASEQNIRNLMNYLQQDNLIVQWQSNKDFPNDWIKGEVTWATEPLYDSQYANGDLAFQQTDLIAQSTLPSDFGLPNANPFMPEKLDLVAQNLTIDPSIIDAKKGYDFWYKPNTQFNKPTGMIFGYFGFLKNPDTRDRLLLQLWARLFNDAAGESTYQPYMAGLGYELYTHSNGLTLRTSGYNDKQSDYFYSLVEQIMAFRASGKRLEIAKQDVLKGLNNLESQPPYALARHYFSQTAIKGNAPVNVLQELIGKITVEDVNHFIDQHVQRFQYVGYMTGNFRRSDAEQLSARLNDKIDTCLHTHAYRPVELKNFGPQQNYLYNFDTSSADSTVLYSLIATDNNNATYTQRAYVRILAQLLGAKFYNEFRTEKQYGYIVAVTNQTIERTPAIGFLVQSPNTSTQVLVNEIERFIQSTKWGEKDVSDKEFEQARQAVLAAYMKQPTNLKEEALEEWPHIVEPNHNFNDRKEWITALEELNKLDFLAFMREKIEQNQAARLLITNNWQNTEAWTALHIE
ncbi:Secreted/periplasmic Zn-dependent peptidases, insulinase-like [Marinomonas fungiae]|uniref:Protease 3 n=2 Tax=Marinomonas fungiae TaxID=1137284 RepID=A0A0K6IH56_9GAMM|nr:Secreted/periplasmic Zn-dependent peptidases, insulinase-like [Marinomonas fungiae]